MAAVVTTWRERTRVLQALDGVAHVLIFENRGALVGTSNPHPHCQIYAGSMAYATMAREAEVARSHRRRDRAARCSARWSTASWRAPRRRRGRRISSRASRGSPCMPTRCTSCRDGRSTSLVDLDDEECRSLALVLREVVRRYDAIVGLPAALRAGGPPGPRRRPPALPVPSGAPPAPAGSRPAQVPGRSRGRRRVHDERVGSRREGGGAPCRPRPDEARRLLCALGDHVRALVADARGMDMSAVAGRRRPTRFTPSTAWPTTRCSAGSRSTGPT